MNKNLELRQLPGSTLEHRQNDDGTMTVSGISLPFNSMSENLGGFREVIPDRVRVDFFEDDVFGLAHHDWTRILGRKSADTFNIERTDAGFRSTYRMSNNPNNLELYQSIERNDIRNQSFGFWTERDSWDINSEIWIRYLEHIVLAETSIVPLAAYRDTDISRALRSMDGFKENLREQKEAELASFAYRQRELEVIGLGPFPPNSI